VRDEDKLKEMEKVLSERLLIKTKIDLYKGLKTTLEDLVILFVWTSALFSMNCQSFVDLSFVVLFYINRSRKTMRVLMMAISVVLVVRLGLTLSNMHVDVSPMRYPEFAAGGGGSNRTETTTYIIPWIRFLPAYQDKDDFWIDWWYWLTIINFKAKLPCLLIDFTSISLLYIYH